MERAAGNGATAVDIALRAQVAQEVSDKARIRPASMMMLMYVGVLVSPDHDV